MTVGQRKPEGQWIANKRKHKPELRPTKDFEAKYNKVKAKLAFLSSSASSSKSSMVKNKGLIVEAYEWDEEDVSSDDNEMVEVKCIIEQIPTQKKRIIGVDQLIEDPFSFRQKDLVFVKSLVDDTKVSIPGVERPWLSEAEGFILPNHDTGRILLAESQMNTTDPSVPVTDSSATNYDSTNESSVCSTPLLPLEKLAGVEPVFGSKTIKSILKSNSTFKSETLKSVIINEPSSAPAKVNKKASALKYNSAPAGKLKNTKNEDDFPLAIVMKKLNDLKLLINKKYISKVKVDPLQENTSSLHAYTMGSVIIYLMVVYTIPYCDIRKPIWYLDSGCSRHMTGVKSYLRKYVKQPRPKVVFRDDSTCITKGYGSFKCKGIVFVKVAFVNGLKYNLVNINQLCDAKYIIQFDEKRETIFNSNKEIVMIVPRVKDVYVLDMTSSTQESCFFAKAIENLNWLWHKRLAHLNFKTINQLAKQNLMGLPSLVYSKDKPCPSCKNKKHHRASFKTKQTSFILLHMDLFGPATPRSINHKKYTLVIINEYSRNTILVNFYDEKGISQNFSSPYTLEQIGVSKRKLVEAARTMLSGSVFSKQYWIEVVATACYTQNRSTIIKRHLKTHYEIFRGRIPNIDFLRVFGCPVYIHKYTNYIGKFDEKADGGYFLGYSLVSKAFRVFNTIKQQTKETYHVTFDESTDAIKFKNIQLTTSTLLNLKNVHQMNIFITMNLLKDFLYEEETKKVSEALKHPGRVDAMQDELYQFARNKVWVMVVPYGKTIIGLKYVFMNKRDETRIVIKNKARLIAQGYNQQKSIDYDETFAPVAMLEAIRIFLAFATYMNFIVYQMDVKSALFNGKLKEEVYVKQPLGFESSEFPNHVCKLDKSHYRLKQAPRAWDTASSPCRGEMKLKLQEYTLFVSTKGGEECKRRSTFATFDLLGFWKAKESTFPVLSRMTMDIISVQATLVAFEFAFSTSGRVLSIRRTRLPSASLEMCMCLKDHLDAQERKQHKSSLENPIDFKEEILDAEVQQNEAISLSEEEIAIDVASSEGTMSGSGLEGEEIDYDMTNYGYDDYK
nr:retrovirus-related Pol polyprotein from transposon TNT 1-94 [Tanacetum cinerariifolium]